MKKTIRLLGIIAMVAVIAFSITACGKADKDKKVDKANNEATEQSQGEGNSIPPGTYDPTEYQQPSGDRGGDDYTPPWGTM